MFSFYLPNKQVYRVSADYGFLAIFGLSIAFGVMYLPVKRHNMGNGMFFQWVMSIAIAFFTLMVHFFIGSPKIWSLTTLSGFLWATGNVAAIPIVKRLGVGVGMLIWSMVNLLMGWASSRFGWFGLQPEVPRNNIMNIIGVLMALLSAIIYGLINPPIVEQEAGSVSAVVEEGEVGGEVENTHESMVTQEGDPLLHPDTEITQFQLLWNSHTVQRILGVGLSVISGLFYGVVFVPIIYAQENYPEAEQRGISYILPIGLGAFMASTIYFVVYCLMTRNKPIIPPSGVILPAMLSGLFCGVGQACWLIANEALQASITFPIAATLPGAIATLIGTLFYQEVRGMQNYIKLVVALCFTLSGSLLAGLSK